MDETRIFKNLKKFPFETLLLFSKFFQINFWVENFQFSRFWLQCFRNLFASRPKKKSTTMGKLHEFETHKLEKKNKNKKMTETGKFKKLKTSLRDLCPFFSNFKTNFYCQIQTSLIFTTKLSLRDPKKKPDSYPHPDWQISAVCGHFPHDHASYRWNANDHRSNDRLSSKIRRSSRRVCNNLKMKKKINKWIKKNWTEND